MFFNLIKEINRSRKEINRLLSNAFNSVREISRLRKGINTLSRKDMSLKVTIETFSKLPFSGFKKFVARSFLGTSDSRRYH